jgi:hypothetical protein
MTSSDTSSYAQEALNRIRGNSSEPIGYPTPIAGYLASIDYLLNFHGHLLSKSVVDTLSSLHYNTVNQFGYSHNYHTLSVYNRCVLQCACLVYARHLRSEAKKHLVLDEDGDEQYDPTMASQIDRWHWFILDLESQAEYIRPSLEDAIEANVDPLIIQMISEFSPVA